PARLQGGKVRFDQLSVGVTAQPLADQLRRRSERDVHRLAPQLHQRPLPLRPNLAACPLQQVFLLLVGLLHREGPFLLGRRPGVSQQAARLGPGIEQELLVLLHEGGPLRPGALSLRIFLCPPGSGADSARLRSASASCSSRRFSRASTAPSSAGQAKRLSTRNRSPKTTSVQIMSP